MKNNKKKLVIITGITGEIGNSFLHKYSRMDNTVIYGISRKATTIGKFVNPETGKLYDQTFITNIEALDDVHVTKFVDLIDVDSFETITYVHALGLFPFEIDENGEAAIENDRDNDGINDEVMELSYKVFTRFVTALERQATRQGIKLATFYFGSLSDHYMPTAHQSWWKVKELTMKFMKEKSEHVGMNMVNISSVVCTHEIITRPFIFTQTDADIKYWLLPSELTERLFKSITKQNIDMFHGYREYEIYNPKPNFEIDYYEDSKFSARKVKEIYKVK